jgi:hypothetical protein
MSDDWKVYRTRFLVRARQLSQPLTFTDPLGREHHGQPGDYIVESSEGLMRIAAREIFEDIYVVLEPAVSRETAPEPISQLPLHPIHFPYIA